MKQNDLNAVDFLFNAVDPRSIVPAIVFAVSGVLIYIASGEIATDRVIDVIDGDSQVWWLIAVAAIGIVIQLVVAVLSRPVLQFLEGYNWQYFGLSKLYDVLVARKRRQFENARRRLQVLLDDPNEVPLSRDEVPSLQSQVIFMPISDRVLPTALGNILRSGEDYPYRHFGIPGVKGWPHLWLCLPPHARQAVNAAERGTYLSVEWFVWSLLFSFAALGLSGWWRLLPIAVSLSGAWCSYAALLSATRNYVNIFRACFDLYRFELYDQLRLPKPPSPNEELIIAHKRGSVVNDFLSTIVPPEVPFCDGPSKEDK